MMPYLGSANIECLFIMASTSKSCERLGGQYCVVGLPNGVSCQNGQYMEGKSIHEFPNKAKEKSRHQSWLSFVRKHRPNWNSTNSSILCSDHFEESCFARNHANAMELRMKIRLKADAIPTIDLSSVEIEEAGEKPLTQRAQRQVSHPCLLPASQTFKVGTSISAKLFRISQIFSVKSYSFSLNIIRFSYNPQLGFNHFIIKFGIRIGW